MLYFLSGAPDSAHTSKSTTTTTTTTTAVSAATASTSAAAGEDADEEEAPLSQNAFEEDFVLVGEFDTHTHTHINTGDVTC